MLGMELLHILGKMGRLSLSDLINAHRDGSLPAHLPSNMVFMYERFHFMTIVLHRYYPNSHNYLGFLSLQ